MTLKDRQQVITAVLPWAQLNTLYEILPYTFNVCNEKAN